MSHLGFGVMLGLLSGNKQSVEALLTSLNKTISSISFSEDALALRFEDGSVLAIWDDGQSCCESRYMVCDDDLGYYHGTKFLSAEVVDGPDVASEYDSHEVQFLNITTDKGVFQIASHNEHNGYYGGFLIRCRLSAPDPEVSDTTQADSSTTDH